MHTAQMVVGIKLSQEGQLPQTDRASAFVKQKNWPEPGGVFYRVKLRKDGCCLTWPVGGLTLFEVE